MSADFSGNHARDTKPKRKILFCPSIFRYSGHSVDLAGSTTVKKAVIDGMQKKPPIAYSSIEELHDRYDTEITVRLYAGCQRRDACSRGDASSTAVFQKDEAERHELKVFPLRPRIISATAALVSATAVFAMMHERRKLQLH